MPPMIPPTGKKYEQYSYSHDVIGHPVYKRNDDGKGEFQFLIAHCPHDSGADVVRTKSANGAPLFRWRCLRCKQMFAVVSRADVERTSTPWTATDVTMADQMEYMAEVNRHVSSSNEKNRQTWLQKSQQRLDADYQQYLQSHSWRLKRDAVMRRDNRLCQGCLRNQATEVHHLTYDRIFDEMLFDLVAVCHDCHINKIHKNKGAR